MPKVVDQARVSAGILAARTVAFASRKAGRGGGTSLPGQVARWFDPAVLTRIAARLPEGSIVVAGTNGKTTTSRMIAGILAANDRRVIHNRAGSNLVQGVTTAFVMQSSWTGTPNGTIAVIETDEAAFPEVVRLVQPRLIVLNNLFRDQLDRYGELDTIGKSWGGSLRALPSDTVILYNADDPGLSSVVEGVPGRTVPFGLTECEHTLEALPHAADSRSCPRCGTDLEYRQLYLSHLGNWHCPNCGNARPSLAVCGYEIELNGADSSTLTVDRGSASARYVVGVPGLYNSYNALAAIAAALELGTPEAPIRTSLATYESAFGRAQRLDLNGRTLTLTLAKNPTGFNEVLRMYTSGGQGLTMPVLIAINDNSQDGRDVSWLWDVDFELLAAGDGTLYTTGLRSPDMANRLKYAGVPAARITDLPTNLEQGLDAFVASIPAG
ncbi:MAG TPA: MurT ligase domain-containing protein, partial [Thermomicrobiales bacterium]|nr:MurT ligase domain-containing protein [Thermomicrobiales bacterium]